MRRMPGPERRRRSALADHPLFRSLVTGALSRRASASLVCAASKYHRPATRIRRDCRRDASLFTNNENRTYITDNAHFTWRQVSQMSIAGRSSTLQSVDRTPARLDPPLAACRHRATQLTQNGRRALTAKVESLALLCENAMRSAAEIVSAPDARADNSSRRTFAEIRRISRGTQRSMVSPGEGSGDGQR